MIELLSIAFRIHFDSKNNTYILFHCIADLVDAIDKMQTHTHNESAYMLPPYNRTTTCYN